MKNSKRITVKSILLSVAQDMTKQDIKSGYDSISLAQLDAMNLKEVQAIRKALLNGRFYMGVESVSASGMSRIIKIKFIDDNELHGVTGSIYRLAGCDKNRRISGCGMDMLFHAQYNLFQAICPDKTYQRDMKRYNQL